MESDWLWILVLIFVVYKVFDRLIRIPVRQMKPLNANYNVVVTGCDSGFGNLFVRKMDRPGFQVFAGCLTETGMLELNSQTSDRVHPFLLNVTDALSIENGVQFVNSRLKANEGVDALINNAGVALTSGPAEWLQLSHYKAHAEVNLFGLIEVTRFFLPLLHRSTCQARIVNTASILGRLAIPGSAPYAVSKFGVEAYSDCLRRELRPFNITVHIIEPGFFKTSLTDADRHGDSVRQLWNQLPEHTRQLYGDDEHVSLVAKSTRDILNLLSSSNVGAVVSCYEHAVTAVYPRARYQPGNDARWVLWPLTLLPEWISDALITAFSPKPCQNSRKQLHQS